MLILKIIKKEYPFDGSICGESHRADEIEEFLDRALMFGGIIIILILCVCIFNNTR